MVVLGLPSCSGFSLVAASRGYSLVAASRGYSLVAVPRRLTVMASLIADTGSRALGLQGSWQEGSVVVVAGLYSTGSPWHGSQCR